MRRKYFLLMIVSGFLFVNLTARAAYSCYTTTPNGSNVYMICHDSEPLSAAQIAAYNQAADDYSQYAYRWGDASGKYNCHSYAWWWTSYNNYAWMNSPNDDTYWTDGSYSPANSWSQSTRISYYNNNPDGDHSGRNYPGHAGWIYSKWGKWPRMVHWYTDTPYDSSVLNFYY